MPLADPSRPPEAKEPAFDDQQIDALVAYVGTLGDGPPLPDVDVAAGDLSGRRRALPGELPGLPLAPPAPAGP